MIITAETRKEQAEKRIKLRCSAETLSNVITEGTNCSSFEADIITQKAREIFRLDEYSADAPLQPGQMVWQAIDKDEPAGKPLCDCKYQRIVLTIHRLDEDRQVHADFGASRKRQQQILRITEEALQQNCLLTIEDLGVLLDCNEKTIRRDMQEMREREILVPTRGNKKDIGPGVTHRYKALELFVRGQEPLEISIQITHSLKAVERYIQSFCRIIYAYQQTHNILQTALITGCSVHLVNTCLEIRDKMIKSCHWKERIEQIEQCGARFWEAIDSKKKDLQYARRQK